jgi:hypothetical protein
LIGFIKSTQLPNQLNQPNSLAELEQMCYNFLMISGKQSQRIPSQVNPNKPDGRAASFPILAPIHPQRMLFQDGGGGADITAVLAADPDYYNMLVLPSQSLVPGLFPPSFKTGTTLPPPADPSSITCVSSRPFPYEMASLDEHVVLLH